MIEYLKNTGGLRARTLTDACRRFKEDATENPLLNPVRRLASDLFRALEAETLSIEDLAFVVREVSEASFEERAAAFHQRRDVGARDPASLTRQLETAKDFDGFRNITENARAGVVFTAHPTFALGTEKRRLIASYPGSKNEPALNKWREALSTHPDTKPGDITLRYEHGEARNVIENAQNAIRTLNEKILSVAEKRFPDQWALLDPNPVSLATWVGYDLDGRTDIHWGETIRIRLEEKAAQLRRYMAALDDILSTESDSELTVLRDELKAAAMFAAQQTAAFGVDLNDPDLVVQAANLLTGSHPGRIVSLGQAIETLNRCIKATSAPDRRRALMLLRAEMRSCGLGVARIHLRVNAAQVRSALRADLGLDPDGGFMGRSALEVAAKKATETQKRAVNFGSVFLEKMTARRQFMLCAQILKHIDADTPIRFLIAECEAPATVMGAVYLARLYGVDDKIDISPLFETAQAIESGGRFIERLLKEQEYRDYVVKRGRVSIQIGFSDSGRFMGQCAAALAIERLQVLFARALSTANLSGVEALIFNTHGESMGRGAHAGNYSERLNHLVTPWVKSRFAKEKLALNTECSFQGGEGFLHFQTAALSTETVGMLWTDASQTPMPDTADQFYADINFSWDFYRNLKSWQETLFDLEEYHRVLTTLSNGLLFKTGSREVKRQKSDAGRPDLSTIRAIPHNALLQQLAIPVNVSGGIGMAAGREGERLVEHIAGSPRMRELMSLASSARNRTDILVLRAYAGFYAPSYWSNLASMEKPAKAESYDAVQQALGGGDTAMAFQRLADFLARDLRLFDAVSAGGDGHDPKHSELAADRLGVLHAIRQAFIAHAISLVASAPSFSRRHDIDHGELVDLALNMKLQEATEYLESIFPAQSRMGKVFADLEEKTDSAGLPGGAYPEVHANIIEPLNSICGEFRNISLAISNHYGAYG